MPKFKLKSIEDASVIRKFSVLFSLMSFFPFIVLSVLFFYLQSQGVIKLNLNLIFWSVFLVGVFGLIGFFGMRKTLVNLAKITQKTREVLHGKVTGPIDIKAAGNNEVAQIVHAFNGMVRRLEDNVYELQKSKDLLQGVLSRIASGVSSTENINAFLDLILETTVNALGAKNGLLLLSDKEKSELVVKSSFGSAVSVYTRAQRIQADAEVISLVIKQERPLLIPRLQKAMTTKARNTNPAFQPPLICAPLVFQNEVIGAISINSKKGDANFVEDDLIMLSNLASQIALAIENEKLNTDVQKTYLETLTALALAVEARDPYSRGHSDRVGEYSVKIARKLGLDEEKVIKIKEAAQLHDVGKIGISDEILRKPDLLNDYEKEIMRQHPVIGEGIIIPLHGFTHLREPIRHHHEWLNGDGYPDHLKGEEISLEARILSVADTFDAITTDRPYRKGLDFVKGKQELLKFKEARYDTKVVEAFMECL